jgi:hypothetical protein
VDLALVARSAPVSLLELPPVLGGAGGDLLGFASVGRSSQPRRRRRAVLSHEHVAASSSVQLLEGGLVATTVAAPSCRRPSCLPCSSGSIPVSSSSPSSFCALAMVAWPASQACLPMLLLRHAVAVALLKPVLLLLLCLSLCC